MNDTHMIGNAHLDPAWMWRLEEGLESFLATCRSALARMDETPGFIFTASSAAHYEFVEKTDPELFKKIQEAVAIGKWSIVGGWWVESDCNLPGGETFIRQGLYGQHYFKSRFGKMCKTGYCIDSFGHHANLPQLLARCGMSRYVFMRPEEHEKHLEDSLFKWRSPSGNEVVAYRIPLHYSSYKNSIQEKLTLLSEYPSLHSHPWMIFYGVGNHGGGPTKEQIAQILSAKETDPRVRFSSVDDFFDEIENIELPTITDEMQPHAIGCYSAHSEIKKLHRVVEQRLLRAEKFCIMAETDVKNYEAHWQRLNDAWKNLLLNSFHDILGGVAIKEACDDAIALYHESLAIASREEREAIQVLSNNIDTSDAIESLLIFNPHPWKISAPVEFELWHPDASEKGQELDIVALTDSDGEQVIAQKIESSGKIGGDRVRFTAQVESASFGWKKLVIARNPPKPKTKSLIKAKQTELSNGICGIVFEGDAKENQIKYTPAQVFADDSDTWGHGIRGFANKKGLFKIDKVTVLEKGPVRGRVRVESSYGNSRLEEDFILYEGADHIEQRVFLDWRKTNAVLKLRYEHAVPNATVHYEIPYSVIERPLSPDEVPGGAWAFIQNSDRGLGILNDAKYSYSSDEKYFYLTIARSPLYAHHVPPHVLSETQTKRYLDQGEQEFIVRLIPGKKSWQEAEMPRRGLEFLQAPVAHIESGHPGILGAYVDGFTVSKPNILITVFKRSHDEQESGVIIRCIETLGVKTEYKFESADLSSSWESSFLPFELKSFQVSGGKVLEINGIEQVINS
jgi:alpha-mannosidase